MFTINTGGGSMKLDDLKVIEINQLGLKEGSSIEEYRVVLSRSVGCNSKEYNTLYVELVPQTKIPDSGMKKFILKTSDKTSIPTREGNELTVCYDFRNGKPSTELFYDNTFLSHQKVEESIIVKMLELLFGSLSIASKFWFSGIRQVVRFTFTYEE